MPIHLIQVRGSQTLKEKRVILFSHKKGGILPFLTTWIDFEGIMLNEISQTQKDKSV